MSDLISREMAIDAMEKVYCHIEMIKKRPVNKSEQALFLDLRGAIRTLPSAQPERKRGKWIRITQDAIPEQYMCPFCHRTVEIYGIEELLPIRYPYCHCGADMKGEQNERPNQQTGCD